MKKIRISALCILISLHLSGQQAFEVTYQYLNVGKKTAEEAKLFFTNQKSLFIFEKQAVEQPQGEAQEEETIQINLGGPDADGKQIFKDFEQGKLVFRDFIAQNGKTRAVIVEENLPALNWNLTGNSTTIGKYLCYQATTSFRGRQYEAWYTLEIPVSNGPWKFQGLPGLILAVQTTTRDIQFSLTHIRPAGAGLQLVVPQAGEPMAFQDYVATRERAVDDYVSWLLSKMPRGTRVSKISVGEDPNLETDFSGNERQ